MSVEAESIQSILGESPFVTGETAAPPAVETKPEAPAEIKQEATEQKPDRVRDETGKFAKAEEKTEKPAEKPAETKPRADVAAIIDERRKRQALEQELVQLRQAQAKPTERPSVFENEDAAIRSRMDEHSAPVREAIYKLSVKTARAIYKDSFDEAAQAFADASDRDPRLIAGLQASDDPGEYIYTMGIHVRELADVGGDLMKYRDKVTAASQSKVDEQSKQIAALTAELDSLKKSQAELSAVPRSLNGLPSTPVKAGDEDADDIHSIVRFK
jgi:hypothetical protein